MLQASDSTMYNVSKLKFTHTVANVLKGIKFVKCHKLQSAGMSLEVLTLVKAIRWLCICDRNLEIHDLWIH